MEGILSRADFALFGIGKKFRYYNISVVTEDVFKELEKILDCESGEYSAYYFFKNN